jgi:hypothetical protein
VAAHCTCNVDVEKSLRNRGSRCMEDPYTLRIGTPTALVTADLDTLTILHTHMLCIHPKNVSQRSSALA